MVSVKKIHEKLLSHLFTVTKYRQIRILYYIQNSLGAPEGIRTPDPLLRRQLLYPTELQARFKPRKV